MNSMEIFKQNQYLKQLIQQQQLLQRLRDPFTCWKIHPPTLLLEYGIGKQNQQFTQDMPLTEVQAYKGISDSTLSYPQPSPLKWPKSRNASDVEFEFMTGYNPNNLLFQDLSQLGLANRITGQLNSLYKNDIIPVHEGFSSDVTKFKLNKSLKDRITFLHHEKQGFKDYNRYW